MTAVKRQEVIEALERALKAEVHLTFQPSHGQAQGPPAPDGDFESGTRNQAGSPAFGVYLPIGARRRRAFEGSVNESRAESRIKTGTSTKLRTNPRACKEIAGGQPSANRVDVSGPVPVVL